MKEIFDSRTKTLDKINISDTLDILDDISIHLAFDFESAKPFFSNENAEIPSNIDLKYIKHKL